jgi:hypothetical protein
MDMLIFPITVLLGAAFASSSWGVRLSNWFAQIAMRAAMQAPLPKDMCLKYIENEEEKNDD